MNLNFIIIILCYLGFGLLWCYTNTKMVYQKMNSMQSVELQIIFVLLIVLGWPILVVCQVTGFIEGFRDGVRN